MAALAYAETITAYMQIPLDEPQKAPGQTVYVDPKANEPLWFFLPFLSVYLVFAVQMYLFVLRQRRRFMARLQRLHNQ
ncbi:MAG: hypothetical protein CMM07_24740 [Rhodopirellula sp.]|nr:hypothetical protein [Rhodopirellula sp.]